MTTINTASTGASAAAMTVNEKNTKESSAESIQNRFYTLLLTQIKNQDPLNPMENSEVTSQMAQLSTLTGIEKMNTSLQAMTTNMRTSMISQASSVLGKNVVAQSSVAEVSGGQGLFALNVAPEITSMTVDIINKATGKIAKTLTENTPDAGYAKYDLADLPDGLYDIKVTATDKEGKPVTGTTSLVQSKVTSLIPEDDDITLTLSNGTNTKMSAIEQISIA
jgi:flagellar basal-body rod modification protein FlgD